MGTVLIAIFLLCLSAASMAADMITGNVVSVTDGDTVKIACPDGQCRRIRLYGIDAPEIKQDGGVLARDYLNGLLGAGMVQVTSCGSDRYGRIVGKIYCGGRYVNRAMVVAGLAWHYVPYARRDGEMALSQWMARQLKFGVWQRNTPIAPWTYRQNQKMRRKSGRKRAKATEARSAFPEITLLLPHNGKASRLCFLVMPCMTSGSGREKSMVTWRYFWGLSVLFKPTEEPLMSMVPRSRTTMHPSCR